MKSLSSRNLSLFVILLLFVSVFVGAAQAAPRAPDSPAEPKSSSEFQNPLFAYTHLLPSPLTIPAGRLVLGTALAYGVTDSIQLGTDILRDIYQIWNANTKVNFVDYPGIAIGANLSFESYNYKDISSVNPDLQVTSWLPGLVGGVALLPEVAVFVGGNLNISKNTLVTSGLATSGYVHGASAGSDLSWAYNPGRKRGLGNVLSGGVSYDFTYKIAGFGVSHYWRGFRLGIHYYPNATQYKVLPIIAGGAVVDL